MHASGRRGADYALITAGSCREAQLLAQIERDKADRDEMERIAAEVPSYVRTFLVAAVHGLVVAITRAPRCPLHVSFWTSGMEAWC